jgi:hypothetical protein
MYITFCNKTLQNIKKKKGKAIRGAALSKSM